MIIVEILNVIIPVHSARAVDGLWQRASTLREFTTTGSGLRPRVTRHEPFSYFYRTKTVTPFRVSYNIFGPRHLF